MKNLQVKPNSLVKSFAGVSGLYAVGVPLLLLSNIILARTLSVEEFGAFGFAISVATVLSIPVSAGLPMLLTREAASYVQDENWPAYRGLKKVALNWVITSSSLVVLGCFAYFSTTTFEAQRTIAIAICLLPFLGLGAIRSGLLRGLGRPILADGPLQVIQPALLILGYVFLAMNGIASVEHALIWYLVVVIVIFLLGSYLLAQAQSEEVGKAKSEARETARWARSMAPFAMMSAATILGAQAAVLVAGSMGEEEVVAHLRVAERGALLVAIPFHVLNSILGPHIIQALKANSRSAQKRVSRQSSRITFFAALPVLGILAIGGQAALEMLFGAPYAEASFLPMLVLSGTLVAAMSLGHAGLFLNMSGHEGAALVSNLSSLVLTVTLCLYLIPMMGALGAAIAVSTGVIISSLLNMALVRHYLGFTPGMI